MKNLNLLFSILVVGGLALSSCQKHDIDVAPSIVGSVSNLNYTLNGDTAVLTWSLPASSALFKIIVNDGKATIELPANTTSFKYGIIQTNKDYVFGVKLTDAKGNISTGETVSIRREGADPVTNLEATQNADDNGVVVTWTKPVSAVSKVTLKLGSLSADVDPSKTSYTFANVPLGQYNITAVTTNSANQISSSTVLPFKVGATAIAYVGVATDSTTFLATADDDMVAAAKWAFSKYGNAQYVSFNEIKNGTVDLNQFRILWFNWDVVGNNALPAQATDATVVSKITAYHKDGGGLLFNQAAIRYYYNIGRITGNYFIETASGAGFSNNDTWGIGVKIGRTYDQSSHPIFKDIQKTTLVDHDGKSRITFPVLGPGYREDHNALFLRIPESLGNLANDNPEAYKKFSEDNNLEWLGQWDGMGDFWMVGIFELKPKADFKGTSIFFGIGAIEWNQNSGVNIHQGNIEKMYANAIAYLRTK